MKKSIGVFNIWFLSFNDGADPMYKFVPDVVHDEHFVLALGDLPCKILPYIGVVVNGCQRAHMKVFFERPVRHGVYPGFSVYGRSGGILERDHPTIARQLFRVFISGKEAGEYRKVKRGNPPDTRHGGNQPYRPVESIVGKDQFSDLPFDTFDLIVEALIDLFEVLLCELAHFRGEELKFVRILIEIGPGVHELLSDLGQQPYFFKDLRYGLVKFYLAGVFKGVLGDTDGIDPIVLTSGQPNALGDLYGHFHTEVGLSFNKFGDNELSVHTGMLHTHQRVLQRDLLILEKPDKGIGPLFGIFEYIRGSPFILDDGHVESLFRYVDTDKEAEVLSVHNVRL